MKPALKFQQDKNLCIYLHMHQPFRLTRLNYIDLGTINNYFLGSGEGENKRVLEKVAEKSYLPTLKILSQLTKLYPEFRFSLSITGVLIEQLQEYCPEVIKLIQQLVKTGKLEILAETYYHSLASLYSLTEFAEQVTEHYQLIKDLFNYSPVTFRNTELIYSNRIAALAQELGFRNIIAEGWDDFLGTRSSNYCYEADPDKLEPAELKILKEYRLISPKKSTLKLLLKNYKLSDDIAFRFSNRDWPEHPLTTEKFLDWVEKSPGKIINLFMDFETFGEHQWADTGIFDFLSALPGAALARGIGFKTIAEAGKEAVQDVVSVPKLTSWADMERDLSAWNGNKIQQSALESLYDLESLIFQKLAKQKYNNRMKKIQTDWRRLQTSDHFYYMSTKYWSDGDVHKYFSPYDSPYEAFINFMNILEDFRQRIDNM